METSTSPTKAEEIIVCGMHCLSGLKVWDVVFEDNTPYKIVAAIIAGKPVGPGMRAWMDDMERKLQQAISMLGVESGALLACQYLLTAIRMSYEAEPSALFVYNSVAKATNALKRARGE